MSMIGDYLAEAAEKREKEVIAWAVACGEVDGMDMAAKIVLDEAKNQWGQRNDDLANHLRVVSEKILAEMRLKRDLIPRTPDPSPEI